jgi:predicted regulator of Ras-like GTPase activity (Roadblock/LC7/MglB family)
MLQSMSTEQSQQMEALLTGLLVKAEALAVFLCDRGGNILAQHSAQDYSQEDTIAALASGSFYATRVLAELLGESEFRQCIHQGSSTSMFMQSMRCDMMVLVVFGRESNPGLVKLYCNEVCQEIDRVSNHEQIVATGDGAGGGHAFEMHAGKPIFNARG